ncbi:GDSL-type esterase/lipase family protein [Thalassotalea maritima]|uniref:GDSL-type esterase/lipase family protein n=1 Tax=Thalassotalea maritima TaxID=3242416 RepID=UPI0035279AE7
MIQLISSNTIRFAGISHVVRIGVLIISCSLFLSSCSSDRLKPLPYSAKILAFGDSLTAGYGVSKVHRYPSVLAELTGLEVINAGISGEVTEDGLKRLPTLLQQHRVQLMVLLQGGNDILRNKSLSKAQQNLAQMIEIAHQQNIDVVLIGVPEKKLFSSAAPFYEELAEQYDLVYDGEIIRELLTEPEMKSDSVHFNNQGYRQLALTVHQLLKDNGAL